MKKSFWGDEPKFLEPLMRFARGDMRDHIVSHNNDHGVSYRRYGILQWWSRLKILEIVATGGGLKPTRVLSSTLDLITTRTLQLRKLRSIGDILAEEPRGFANDGSRVSPIIITNRQGRSGRSAVLNEPRVASASVCGLLANGPKGARRLPTKVVFTEAAVIRSPSDSKANLSSARLRVTSWHATISLS